MPRSTPATASGRAGVAAARSTSAWKATCQRPPRSRRTVADRIRAVPPARRRWSLRVFSWVRIVPSRGRVTWRRPGSIRITPVVNRTVGVLLRRDLNRGNPIFGPVRLPVRDSFQLPSARARASRPVL
jgi:hypothetical protein